MAVPAWRPSGRGNALIGAVPLPRSGGTRCPGCRPRVAMLRMDEALDRQHFRHGRRSAANIERASMCTRGIAGATH